VKKTDENRRVFTENERLLTENRWLFTVLAFLPQPVRAGGRRRPPMAASGSGARLRQARPPRHDEVEHAS
jgi:hypothetical protein